MRLPLGTSQFSCIRINWNKSNNSRIFFRLFSRLQLVCIYPQNTEKILILRKCREVLALHLLPRNKIKIEFERLRREARDKHLGLEMLFQYIENNWIKKKCWRPVRWANYFRFIRTNNDTEGWHRRLNGKFKSKPNIFKLVFALLEESNYIRVQVSHHY